MFIIKRKRDSFQRPGSSLSPCHPISTAIPSADLRKDMISSIRPVTCGPACFMNQRTRKEKGYVFMPLPLTSPIALHILEIQRGPQGEWQNYHPTSTLEISLKQEAGSCSSNGVSGSTWYLTSTLLSALIKFLTHRRGGE